MAIDGNGDDVRTGAMEAHVLKPALIAELAWAKLYTKAMHQGLDLISRAVRKRQSITSGLEMKKSAEKLRDQLQNANRTVGELSDHAGIGPAPEEKSDQV